MKLIEQKLRLSKTGKTVILVAVLSLLTFSSAVAAVFSLNIQQRAKETSPIDGDWELFLTDDDNYHKGSIFEFPLGVSLKLEGKRPVGIIRLPMMNAAGTGPKQEATMEKVLRDTAFDGRLLSFRIEGEGRGDFLVMTMELTGENFAGRWKVSRSGEGGTAKMVRKQNGKTALREKIIGEWSVVLLSADGTQAEGEYPVLIVKADGDRLTAKTVFNIAGEKKEWVLIEPKFDGETFIFKVDNGEEVLEGRLKLTEDRFEGPWKASKSGVSGTMKLIRKK